MAKLIFFIHGVAVRNSDYAEPLPKLIKNALNKRNKEVPYIHKGFWGNFSGKMDEMWTSIDRDFSEQKQQNFDFDGNQSFKYQPARRGLLSRFTGDVFNYLNTDVGCQIRRAIYSQINQILNIHLEIREIYFITHSFGTVILWDILFSQRFLSNDPALDLRTLLRNRISLQGIVTMGSPIAMINMTLGTTPSNIKDSLRHYSRAGQPICWLNFINGSDLIAYPIRPLLREIDHNLITVEDVFDGDANYLDQVSKKIDSAVQVLIKKNDDLEQAIVMLSDIFGMSAKRPSYLDNSIAIREGINLLPGIVGTPNAHSSYFKDSMIANRMATMICPKNTKEITQDILDKVILRLNQVPGMTNIKSEFRQKLSQQLNFTDEILSQFNLRDNLRNDCGFLILTRNIVRVHHVTVVDRSETIQFLGYVGLIHGEGLCQAVKKIQAEFGMR
ncbi:hypothetical protein [Spirulina subsalsa]|uniref:hypothetical protein n=1 Tax=Spirulina subsalsa TaxID=54311 RepID=UPI000315EE2B|nr:hypothetical protein [Spirulina subsalsa]